jgi:glycosyltransferase involved in cell wall biosynthesis
MFSAVIPRKTSNQPLISVVIPAYNRARLLPRTLKSVQEQTHQNWEAIIVDDGSRDDTAEVAARLAREDDRIRLIRQEKNAGAQAARNRGIRAARGQWVAFLDSDDLFLPESLEIRLAALFKENLSVVYSDCNYIGNDGSIKRYGIPPLSGWIYDRLLMREGPLFQALLVSKQALARIGYLDQKVVAFQEWDTAIRLAKHYPFGFVSAPTFLYDTRHSDSMSKNSLLGARGYEQVFQKHRMRILLTAGPGGLARHYETAANAYERAGDRASNRRCKFMAQILSCLDIRTVFWKVRKAMHLTNS